MEKENAHCVRLKKILKRLTAVVLLLYSDPVSDWNAEETKEARLNNTSSPPVDRRRCVHATYTPRRGRAYEKRRRATVLTHVRFYFLFTRFYGWRLKKINHFRSGCPLTVKMTLWCAAHGFKIHQHKSAHNSLILYGRQSFCHTVFTTALQWLFPFFFFNWKILMKVRVLDPAKSDVSGSLSSESFFFFNIITTHGVYLRGYNFCYFTIPLALCSYTSTSFSSKRLMVKHFLHYYTRRVENIRLAFTLCVMMIAIIINPDEFKVYNRR